MGLGAELSTAMCRQGAKAEQGIIQMIPRDGSPPADVNTFRSGWSRPPQVAPPRGTSPAGSQCSDQDASRAPALRGASPAGSQSSSVSSNLSSFHLPGRGSATAPSLRHEGLLCKLSSHKLAGGIAARWQRRYWTLEGCKFSYHKKCGSPPLRIFDLRRVRHMQLSVGRPRELELDFGIRIWRLRAENPQAARRWFEMLDAARLLTGEPLGEDEDPEQNWSDEDSTGSTSSTVDSVFSGCSAGVSEESQTSCDASKQSRNLLPRVVQRMLPPSPSRPSRPEHLPAAAIADRLEVDPDDLSKRFESWLGKAVTMSMKAEGTPHFGTGETTTSLQRGLGEALTSMWMVFGGDGPDSAVATWKGPPMPEPQAFADAADGVLCEYLSQMLRSLERWIQECDPSADEVADAAAWFLFDARASLERFEKASCKELMCKNFGNWHAIANQLEMLLLTEWETRSCDEIFQRVEEAYSMGNDITACYSFADSVHPGKARAHMVLELLQLTLQAGVWRGHAAACDRGASVLIAALNTVLRCYRSYVHSILGVSKKGMHSASRGYCAEEPADSQEIGRGKSVRRATRRVFSRLSKQAINCLEDRQPCTLTRDIAAEAVAEAARLANFCREAQSGQTPFASKGVCSDVLLAFASAFERECIQLCSFIAETHFAKAHRHTLKGINFTTLQSNDVEQGVLSASCLAARGFLDEMFNNPNAPGGAQLCDAVIRDIVQNWVRAFRRGPPRVQCAQVPSLAVGISADEGVLRRLAARFGAEAIWVNLPSTEEPLQPLREVRQILTDSSPEAVSEAAAQLDCILGAKNGGALVNAVRSVTR